MEDRPLKCLDCPESEVYSSENDLEAHIAADHIKMLPYGCGMCKYGRFPTESALFNHHSEVHGNISNITSVFHGSRELPTQRKELAKKLDQCIEASKLPETGDPAPKVEITIDETPCNSAKCLYCPESEVYQSREKLEAHIADVHLKSLPYKCEICKHAMFPTEYMVRCHYHEDHKRSGEFNLIMRCSPEVVLERKELAKRMDICLGFESEDDISSRPAEVAPQRVESPLNISPVKDVERESENRDLVDLSAEPTVEPMFLASSPTPEVYDFEHEVPGVSSPVSSVGASPRQLPISSERVPQASRISTPVPASKTSTAPARKLPGTSAIPRSEPRVSDSSTPVSTRRTSSAVESTPNLSPMRNDGPRKSSRVSKKKVFADFIAEPETAPTSPAKGQRSGKRQGSERSSERSAKRTLSAARPGNASGPSTASGNRTPDIDMTAEISIRSNISMHPNLDLVKSEYPPPNIGMSQFKAQTSAEPSTSARTVYGAGWPPVSSPLKVEEPEDVQYNHQDQNYQQEPEDDPEEHPEDQVESEEERNSEDEDFVMVKKKTRCFTCTVCSVTVKSTGSRLTHACTHGNFVLYECKKCKKTFSGYNINDVKRHIQHKHKVLDDEVIMRNINDLRKQSRAKITKLKDKCFPMKN
ncbi:hypothetical protein CAEBREN_01153 [Caenorhabditis brenneri]|uniref:C2H2-type domain-containing protein n=1 Tax=Caenorhabditis brenneri TaxID=135651 RepID=G0NTL3_CAEBE|nr:hypothetical protein CAEBREN_01153 [Caenorhabditis brenneri]